LEERCSTLCHRTGLYFAHPRLKSSNMEGNIIDIFGKVVVKDRETAKSSNLKDSCKKCSAALHVDARTYTWKRRR